MQKPRPKEATTPERQRSARNTDTSTKGASAPFVVPGGKKAAENSAEPASNGALAKAEEARARRPDTGPAVIVFGYNEHRIPQAAWFPKAEADLAIRAARLMGLRVLRIEDDVHRELAGRLRQCQVYAADQTFAPAVLPEVFGRLRDESMQNRGVIRLLLAVPGHHSRAGTLDSVDGRRLRVCRSARPCARRGRAARSPGSSASAAPCSRAWPRSR